MIEILRVATAIGADELIAISNLGGNARTVIGNTSQFGTRNMLNVRQVSPVRLKNMGHAAAQMAEYSNVVVSGDPEIANALYGSRRMRAERRTFLIRETDPSLISGVLRKLDLAFVDRVMVTNLRTQSVVDRFLTGTPVISEFQTFDDAVSGSEDESSAGLDGTQQGVDGLHWFGATGKGLGGVDFLRVASLLDGPVNIHWARVPEPDEFTRFMSTAASFGLLDRIHFKRVHSAEDLVETVVRESPYARWFYTARDYSEFTGVEVIAAAGGNIIAFNSLHAIELAGRYPNQVELVSEGDYEEAAEKTLGGV